VWRVVRKKRTGLGVVGEKKTTEVRRRSMRVEGESWWARVTSMISEGVQATK
jgi:hypothetical protein